MKRGVIDGCVICQTTWAELRRKKMPLFARGGVGLCKSCLLRLAMDCSRGTGLTVLFRDGDNVRLIEGGGAIQIKPERLQETVERLFVVPEKEEQGAFSVDPDQERSIEESRFGPGGLDVASRPHPSP